MANTTNYSGSGLYSPGNKGSGPAKVDITKLAPAATPAEVASNAALKDDSDVVAARKNLADSKAAQVAAAQGQQNNSDAVAANAKANTAFPPYVAPGAYVDPKIAELQKQITDLQASTAANAAAAQATLNASRQNAIAFLTSTFNDLGLGADMAAAVTNLVQQGYTADTIQMIAQDPKSKDPLAVAFKVRFPANEARMNAGLPVLSPADYINTERSYAQVLQSYGLPAGFAQNKDVFTKLLTNDVSPTELNSRASTAKQVIDNTDPLVTQQLQQYYGLSQGDMIAHVLDPSVATPIIEKQITASQIGAESMRAGTNINQGYAEQLGGLGITQSQANTGFQNIAQSQPGLQELATRYSAYGPAGQVGQQLQAATFGTTGAAGATAELNRLKIQEVSQFSGSSGAGKGSLMGTDAGLS